MDGRVDRGWGRWKEKGKNYELWTDIKRYGKKMEKREEQMERKTWMEDVCMERNMEGRCRDGKMYRD